MFTKELSSVVVAVALGGVLFAENAKAQETPQPPTGLEPPVYRPIGEAQDLALGYEVDVKGYKIRATFDCGKTQRVAGATITNPIIVEVLVTPQVPENDFLLTLTKPMYKGGPDSHRTVIIDGNSNSLIAPGYNLTPNGPAYFGPNEQYTVSLYRSGHNSFRPQTEEIFSGNLPSGTPTCSTATPL